MGLLKDVLTLGFDLLLLATLFRGRASLVHCIGYSSRTIAEEKRSRNMEYRRVIKYVMGMLVLIAYPGDIG